MRSFHPAHSTDRVRLRLGLALILSVAAASSVPYAVRAQQAADIGATGFIENVGQWDRRARFLLRSPELDVWITDNGVIVDDADVSMTFLDASSAATAAGAERGSGHHNYFLGNDSSRWVTNVPLYRRVRIESLYDGIDAVFYVDAGRPRYDLVVSVGADPSQVRLRFDGTDDVRIDEELGLVIGTAAGDLLQRELFAYQTVDGKRRRVPCAFRRDGVGTVALDVGSFDRSLPLVIDPVLIASSTYFGGSRDERLYGAAVDARGSTCITGITTSSNFPEKNDAGFWRNGTNAFVTKVTKDGELLYSTYLGGTGEDYGQAIAIDTAGTVHVTGFTRSDNFPLLFPAQPAFAGEYDVFVTTLDAMGALKSSTYLGGGGRDIGYGIAAGEGGDSYVTGFTTSYDFPVRDAVKTVKTGTEDAFVARVTTRGEIRFSSYLGGGSNERAYAIAADSAGAMYVTGITFSSDFPVMNAMQDSKAGEYEAFVVKLDRRGTFVYSTYLGGSASEFGRGIAVEPGGAAWLTGGTSSTDFPLRNPMQDHNASERTLYDAFVTRLSENGALAYSTYLGGNESDSGNAIVIDPRGNVWVSGLTLSISFPMMNPTQRAIAGGSDAFMTMLTPAGGLSFSTFLGGTGDDEARGIGTDGHGGAYIAGTTASANFPLVNPLQPARAGGLEIFLTKYSPSGGIGVEADVRLDGISPAPVDDALTVSYTLTSPGPVTVEIFSMDGRLMAAPLRVEPHDAGAHNRTVNVASLAPGVYALRFETSGSIVSKRIVVAR